MYFTIKYLAPEKYVPIIAWIDGMCCSTPVLIPSAGPLLQPGLFSLSRDFAPPGTSKPLGCLSFVP